MLHRGGFSKGATSFFIVNIDLTFLAEIAGKTGLFALKFNLGYIIQ